MADRTEFPPVAFTDSELAGTVGRYNYAKGEVWDPKLGTSTPDAVPEKVI